MQCSLANSHRKLGLTSFATSQAEECEQFEGLQAAGSCSLTANSSIFSSVLWSLIGLFLLNIGAEFHLLTSKLDTWY